MSAQPTTASDGCALRHTAVGRALDALEPEDERLIDDHLPHCASCRQVLRESTAVAAWLAVAVPAVEPPPALRARVLALAEASEPPRSEGSEDAEGSRGAGDAGGAAEKAPVGAPREPLAVESEPAPPTGRTSPTPPPPRAARRTQRWALLAVAAVVLGVAILSARALLPGPASDTDTASPPAPGVVLADRAARIVEGAEAADPAGHQATLSDPVGRPLAVVVDDTGGARVVPLALPTVPAGSEYFLWRVVGGATQPMGVVDATSTSRADATSPPDAAPVTAYAISREAAGSRPTEPAVLVAMGRTA